MNDSRYIYKIECVDFSMRLIITTSSRHAIKKIKTQMILQYENKDVKNFKLKFTKKKTFIAVPIPYTGPAFQLWINGRNYKTYFYKDEQWQEL